MKRYGFAVVACLIAPAAAGAIGTHESTAAGAPQPVASGAPTAEDAFR